MLRARNTLARPPRIKLLPFHSRDRCEHRSYGTIMSRRAPGKLDLCDTQHEHKTPALANGTADILDQYLRRKTAGLHIADRR